MSTNMIECPICNFRYSRMRNHCPTCGTYQNASFSPTATVQVDSDGFSYWHSIVVAYGAERARQLPQSPRFFQLVD